MTLESRSVVTSSTSVVELVEHIRKRDSLGQDASRELFERVKIPVWRYVMTLVRDDGVAEGILNQAYMRFWSHAPSLPSDVKVEAWLTTVATNLAIDYFRDRRRAVSRTISLDYYGEGGEGGASRSGMWLQRKLSVDGMEDEICSWMDVWDGLATLGDLDCELVVLYKISGFSQRELAKMYGMKEDAVNKRIGRALMKLRAYLKEERG